MGLAGLVMSLLLPVAGGAPPPATETLAIRGHEQRVRVYGSRGGPVAVVASGDGGWVHLGPQVAEFLSSWGYFVVGFDAKAYLSSFTGGGRTLSTKDVPGDFAALLEYGARGTTAPPLLLGVSEGAALAVLATTDDATKPKVAGVIALGLPDRASPPPGYRWWVGAACATTGHRARPRPRPGTWRASSSSTRRPGRGSASCSSGTRSAPTSCRSW